MRKKTFCILAIISVIGIMTISGCKNNDNYTITFDSNGGSGIMDIQHITAGTAQNLKINTFTRNGYSFCCWNTVQEGDGISYHDGETIIANSDMTLYAQWNLNNPLNGHAWVDMGLPSGILWATCNVGANSPEEYGDYFAWGEIVPKESYNWSNYRYCNGSPYCLTKYCSNTEYGNNGFVDNLTTLEVADDAASANWGEKWRMPTSTEIEELYFYCTREWIMLHGVTGYLYRGPNGNTIFLPSAGNIFDNGIGWVGSDGDYWSSSLDSDKPYNAWGIWFNSVYYGGSDSCRYCGQSVRPVCTK